MNQGIALNLRVVVVNETVEKTVGIECEAQQKNEAEQEVARFGVEGHRGNKLSLLRLSSQIRP